MMFATVRITIVSTVLKREARERAREERELGVTRMYQDNVRALNPYAHS